jgi:hypothetical protein
MILVALVLALAAGQEDRLSKLSAELGSPTASVREQAARDLVAMGRAALATLKALEKDATDPEVRLRAAAASREIYGDLRRSALKLEVSTEKKTYRPGESVTVRVRLKNVEDFPVTVFLGDHDFSPNAHSEIRSGDRRVNIVIPTYQILVMGPVPVDEQRFKTIPPGESVEVHRLSFAERWDLKGQPDNLKASYQDAAKVPLDAGTYRALGVFAFGFKTRKEREAALRDLDPDQQRENRLFLREYKFTPKAESLMAEAWEGSLEGAAEFQVARD